MFRIQLRKATQKISVLAVTPCTLVKVTKFLEKSAPPLHLQEDVKRKGVKCTLVEALRLCTGRTAHREVEV